jgi:hypothetical protein
MTVFSSELESNHLEEQFAISFSTRHRRPALPGASGLSGDQDGHCKKAAALILPSPSTCDRYTLTRVIGPTAIRGRLPRHSERSCGPGAPSLAAWSGPRFVPIAILVRTWRIKPIPLGVIFVGCLDMPGAIGGCVWGGSADFSFNWALFTLEDEVTQHALNQRFSGRSWHSGGY